MQNIYECKSENKFLCPKIFTKEYTYNDYDHNRGRVA